MKILVDENIPSITVQELRSLGHDVLDVRGTPQQGMEDAELWRLDNADLTRIAKARSSDAPKLVSLIRGDLDWIVMKALEKDRSRRYETANALAMDVRRHLSHEPVRARPPSVTYRFQMWTRRHKVAFAAGSAVAIALLLLVVVSVGFGLRQRADALELKHGLAREYLVG